MVFPLDEKCVALDTVLQRFCESAAREPMDTQRTLRYAPEKVPAYGLDRRLSRVRCGMLGACGTRLQSSRQSPAH
jgi:hypothetical protein